MPYCPNPDCPSRRLTGKPAEYQAGIKRCSDCGSALVETNPDPPKPRPPCPRPLKIRLFWTAAVVGVLWLACFIPQPFLNTDFPKDAEGRTFTPTAVYYGPLTMGPTPFLFGFIMVEIVALAVPGLRRRRIGDGELRRKLWHASLMVGVGWALLRGMTTAWQLEQLDFFDFFRQGNQPPPVLYPGWWFRIKTALTMTAGSCLFAVAADLISRKGVGAGFAVVILADALVPAPAYLLALWHDLRVEIATPLAVVLGGAWVCAACWGLWKFFGWNTRRPWKLPLVAPTCGLLPLEVALLLTLMPSLLANFFFDTSWLNWFTHVYPGSTPYWLLNLALVALLTPVASACFYWRRRKAFRSPPNRLAWRRAMLISGGVLLAFVVWEAVLVKASGELVRIWPSPLTLAVVVALFSDLAAEIKARWHASNGADLVPVRVFQDVADALEDLSNSAPDSILQGQSYRSLEYFFAPFVPMATLSAEPPATPPAPPAI